MGISTAAASTPDEMMGHYIDSAIRESLTGTLSQCVTDEKGKQVLFLLATTLLRQRYELAEQSRLVEESQRLLNSVAKPGLPPQPSDKSTEASLTAWADQLYNAKSPEAIVALDAILEADFRANAERESAFLEGLKSALGNQKPQGGKLPDDAAARLQEYLCDAFPTERNLAVISAKAIPGGLSKTTVIVTLDSTVALPSKVVVRMDMGESPLGTTVCDEYDLLRTLHADGVAVPKPLALDASGNVLGAPLMVVELALGKTIGDPFDVHDRQAPFCHDVARQFARMHAIPLERFGTAIYGAGDSTRGRMSREIGIHRDKWVETGFSSPAMEIALSWLERNIALTDGPRTLIHRDTGFHNILAHDGRVSALLDWETAAIGCPAQDLGYARDLVVQVIGWDDFMESYAAAGGWRPEPLAIEYYSLWGDVWVCVMAAQSRFAFITGAAHSIQAAFAGEHILRRYLYKISEKMRHLHCRNV